MGKTCVGFACLLLLMICVCSGSCINSKKITYFNNLPDSVRIQLSALEPPQQYIQVNDILDIKVGGENEKTVQYINQYFSNNSLYTVDISGYVELPKIGKVKVKGLTKDQVKDTITAAYAEYLKEPLVSVNLSNFKFAVLGAVASPGYFSVPNEKINVFEAIAQAGDMTPFAKRDNVKIIREGNDIREIISINFNDKQILNSPDYYLKRYDIIYIEAQKAQFKSENFSRTTGVIGTITGLLAIFITILRK